MRTEIWVTKPHGQERAKTGFKRISTRLGPQRDEKIEAGKIWSVKKMCSLPDDQMRVLEKEKINCRDVKAMFGEYVEGDLIPSLKGRIDSHIDECKKCKNFKNDYLATIELAKSLKPASMTSDVQNRLRAALNARLGLQLNLVRPE